MLGRLILLFIALPLLEMAILIKLGEKLGFGHTIALVVVTGILGASLAKQQGFRVFRRIQQELNSGKIPASELIDGLLILIGGIVLLTPGLLTDLFGFALLIPWLRQRLKKWLQTKFTGVISNRTAGRKPPPSQNQHDDVIDI